MFLFTSFRVGVGEAFGLIWCFFSWVLLVLDLVRNVGFGKVLEQLETMDWGIVVGKGMFIEKVVLDGVKQDSNSFLGTLSRFAHRFEAREDPSLFLINAFFRFFQEIVQIGFLDET